MFGPVSLPETPPNIDEKIEVTAEQTREISRIISGLSEGLEALPVVVSQHGDVIASAGVADAPVAQKVAKLANRLWRDGSHRLAREVLRFEEEVVEEGGERTNFMIYSIHIAGGITLTVNWYLSFSLTQIRAEVSDAKESLLHALGIHEE